MAKKRSRLLDYLVYLAVRTVVCILQTLPYAWSMGLANGLAWLMYKVDRRHRLVADENLRLAFPDLHDERQRDELIRGVYRHFCGVIVALVNLPRKIHVGNSRHYIRMSRPRELVRLLLHAHRDLLSNLR